MKNSIIIFYAVSPVVEQREPGYEDIVLSFTHKSSENE